MGEKTINLFDLGCLVQLSVGTWSARKMLTREDMRLMGASPDDLPEALVNLGRKLMVSKTELSKFSQVMQRARGYLNRWSIAFGIGNAQFVPADALVDVMAHLEGYQKEFFETVDSFVSRYDQLRVQIHDEHPEFYEKCLRRHYPASAEALRHKFYFRFFTFQIAGMDGMTPITLAEAQTAAKLAKDKETEMRKQMRKEVDRFIEEAVGILRAETVRFCNLVEARVNGAPYEDEDKSKKFTPRSLRCFQEYVERFRTLNIFGDDGIEKMLVELKTTYLDNATVSELQTPQMAKAITEMVSKIRTAAASENGEMSEFLNLAKRKIIL